MGICKIHHISLHILDFRVKVILRHQILLSFLPLFFPYSAVALNPECFLWCYWYRAARKQRPLVCFLNCLCRNLAE